MPGSACAQLGVGLGRVLQVERSPTPRSAGRPSRPAGRCAASSRMRAITSSRRVSANSLVTIGVRPGGSSSIVLTSRSANSVIASVRGIGVALIISRCGSSSPWSCSLLAQREPLCTPKRCCSSTIARPRRAKRTCSWITACVPTTSAASPDADLREHRVARLALAAAGEPGDLRRAARASRRACAKCCSARISVGAISAHCQPASIASAAASAATTVLPEPTSPCSRRCIGMRAARGRRDLGGDALLRRVSANGSAASSARAGAPRAAPSGGARWRSRSRLRLQLRQLLRQQLVELEALPGRVAVVLERRQRRRRAAGGAGSASASRKVGRPGGNDPCRQELVESARAQAGGDRLAQIGLRQLRAWSDRPASARSASGVLRGHGLERRVHHLAAEEAAAHLAAHAHARAGRERLLVRRIEVQEAQHQVVAVVGELDDELAPRPELDAQSLTTPSTCAGLAVAQRRRSRTRRVSSS